MNVKNTNDKIEFYKSLLNSKKETYVLCEQNGVKIALYVCATTMAENGYMELPCELYAYTYTKGNRGEEKFMREQNYILMDDFAYDIQTPYSVFDFEEHLGEMKEMTKEECVVFLKQNN